MSRSGRALMKVFYLSRLEIILRSKDVNKDRKSWSRQWTNPSWIDKRGWEIRVSDPESEAAEKVSDQWVGNEVTSEIRDTSWRVATPILGIQKLFHQEIQWWSLKLPIMIQMRKRSKLRKYFRQISITVRCHCATCSILSIKRNSQRGRPTQLFTHASVSRVTPRMRSSTPTISISWSERAISRKFWGCKIARIYYSRKKGASSRSQSRSHPVTTTFQVEKKTKHWYSNHASNLAIYN